MANISASICMILWGNGHIYYKSTISTFKVMQRTIQCKRKMLFKTLLIVLVLLALGYWTYCKYLFYVRPLFLAMLKKSGTAAETYPLLIIKWPLVALAYRLGDAGCLQLRYYILLYVDFLVQHTIGNPRLFFGHYIILWRQATASSSWQMWMVHNTWKFAKIQC